MNRDEAKMIVRTMCVAYPNFHPEDLTLTVNIWHSMLQEYDYKDVCEALKRYIQTDTTGFAPSIGAITQKISLSKNADMPSEMEAWGIVRSAISRSGYYSQEEFDKFPDVIKRSVGNPGVLQSWSQTDEQTVNITIMSNFLKAYRIESKRQLEDNTIMKKLESDNFDLKGITMK